jgi:hypothetical protein
MSISPGSFEQSLRARPLDNQTQLGAASFALFARVRILLPALRTGLSGDGKGEREKWPARPLSDPPTELCGIHLQRAVRLPPPPKKQAKPKR